MLVYCSSSGLRLIAEKRKFDNIMYVYVSELLPEVAAPRTCTVQVLKEVLRGPYVAARHTVLQHIL